MAKLDSQYLYAFMMRNVPKPTIDLGDGSVAAFHQNIAAIDAGSGSSAATPEPAACLLTGIGLSFFSSLRRKKGASSKASALATRQQN